MTATTDRPLAAPEPGGSGMSHREVLEAMSGLLLAMFVAILSSTVVTTALPRIIGDLGGSQSAYTWVVTSTLLALTVTTPIWGKLSDLFDRKLLVQIGLVLYVGGSILAGLSQTTSLADRLSRAPGHRRRRAHRARAGDPVRPRLAARARPLRRLPRRGVRARDGRRAADRRRRHRLARLALVLLHRRPVRRGRVHPPPAHPAPPAPPPRGEDRLRRRDADRGWREQPADLGLARRPAVRLGLVAERDARRARRDPHRRRGLRRARRARSRWSRCGSSTSAPSCSP